MAANGGIPILLYHALDEAASPISISPGMFTWQMDWLHENGYQVLSLGEVVQWVQTGHALSSRAVAITFDDGFESVYSRAFPVLAQYKFPATIFLVPGYSGRQNGWPAQPPMVPRLPLLSWSHADEMSRHGMAFGAHGFTHARLDRLSPGDVEQEIFTSKAIIEDRLGRAVEFFAYPYGRCNAAVKGIVTQAYRGACTARPGLVRRHSDPHLLERIDAHYLKQAAVFRTLPGPLFSLYLGVRRSGRAVGSVILRRPWA